jgi:hypothetical protein
MRVDRQNPKRLASAGKKERPVRIPQAATPDGKAPSFSEIISSFFRITKCKHIQQGRINTSESWAA